MFHSLWTLIRLQLSEKLHWKADASKAYKVAQVAKRIGYMAVVFGLFALVFYLLFNVVHFLTPSTDLFIFFVGILQLISIISCILNATSFLYTSKDNALLLTYPVKHETVYASKILCMYILELLKSLTLIFPIFMAYATIVSGVFSANFVIAAMFYAIFLPLIPVMLGAIISIPVVFLTKIFKQANWIKGFFSIVLFGGLIFLTVLIVRFIQDHSPIRIVAMANTFNEGVKEFLKTGNNFTLYANFVGKGMMGETAGEIWKNHGLMLAVIVGTAVISVLISMPTFFKLASASAENAATKTRKSQNKAHSNTFITFLRKEVTLSIRNIGNFASDYAFLFAMPFVLIILTAIFVNIDRNELGLSMTYGFIGLISLVMLCASNTASATAISSEGSEFVLLKTAPGKTSNIIWTKLLVNFIISLVMTTVSFIILGIVLAPDIEKGLLDIGKVVLVYFYVCLIEIGLLLWSIQLDIVSPKLREFANAGSKTDIKNTSQSIIIGLIFSVVFSGILILVFILTLPIWAKAILLILVALIFVGLRFYFLIQYRNAFFEDIQL